jgi:hypothetical protein
MRLQRLFLILLLAVGATIIFVQFIRGFKLAGRDKYLLVAILNVCKKQEQRDILRRWFKRWEDIADFKFILDISEKGYDCRGQLINTEQVQYGDLIFLDTYAQGYKNLSYKTKAIMNWYASNPHPNNYRYLVKTDDDAVIRLDKMKEFLQKNVDDVSKGPHSYDHLRQNILAYAGNTIQKSPGETKLRNKLGMDLNYWPYCTGGGYALSDAVVKAIHKWDTISPLMVFESAEDAMVGLWLAPMENIVRAKTNNVWIESGNLCREDFIGFHPLKTAEALGTFVDNFYNNLPVACEAYKRVNGKL